MSHTVPTDITEGSDTGTVTVTGQATDGSTFTTQCVETQRLDAAADMTIYERTAGRNRFVWSEITLTVTGNGDPLQGAVVTGYWASPSSDPVSGTTDAYGQVVFKSGSVKNPSSYDFTFVLTDIVLSGWEYTDGEQTYTLHYPPL